jgi:two-component system response regulator MprA
MSVNNITKKLLVISFGEEILNIGFSDKDKITYFETNKFYLLNSEISSFDLIIFDNRGNELNKFINTFTLTKSYNFNIPMILIENNISEELDLYKLANVYLVLKAPIDEAYLKTSVELCLNYLNSNKKVQLEDGFHFDKSRETLFLGKKNIKLTKTEKKLVMLLAENPNNLVSYEQIESVVWKGKVFSIYSLRNLIMSIRDKTSENFIKNYSNKGYILNTV